MRDGKQVGECIRGFEGVAGMREENVGGRCASLAPRPRGKNG